MDSLRRLLVVSMLVCAPFGRASAAELLFEFANARTGPIRATFVLVKGPASWSRALRIDVVAGATSAQTAGLVIDDVLLETESGMQATAKVTSVAGAIPSELTAGQAATVTITATFAARGLYRGEIVLRQGGLRRVVPLEVNVTAPGGVPFEAEGGHTVAITEPILGEGKVSALLLLRNKGHDAVTLKSVELASATRVDKPVSPGMPLQSPSVSVLAKEPQRAIEPGAVARVPIDLAGIGDPGIYLVDIAVQAEGHEPEEITVTVYRREHWFWALLAIALGAIAAYGVRAFTTGGQERLKLRRRLAILRDRLRALRHQAVEPEHEAAAALLSSELEGRERELRWVSISADVVGTLEQRVELFGEIMIASRQVGRLDDERRTVPRNVLSQALVRVRVHSNEAQVIKARETVAELALDEAWRAQLVATLGELDAQVAIQLARAGAVLHATIVTQVQPLQISAHNLLRQSRLVDAEATIKDAQTRLRDLLVGELRRQISGEPPPGVSKDAWARARESITQLLDGRVDAPAWAGQFQKAQRAYFRTVVEGLAHHAETKAADAQSTDPVRLKAIAVELKSLLASGDGGVDAAAMLYQQRLREVEDATSKPVAARRPIKARIDEGEDGEEGGWSWISLLLSDVPQRGAATGLPAVRQLEVEYRLTNVIVNGVVFAVAVASGMKALWIGNPTWGTDHACLIAFLWGAGVGAVGDAFTGIIGLREKLGASRE